MSIFVTTTAIGIYTAQKKNTSQVGGSERWHEQQRSRKALLRPPGGRSCCKALEAVLAVGVKGGLRRKVTVRLQHLPELGSPFVRTNRGRLEARFSCLFYQDSPYERVIGGTGVLSSKAGVYCRRTLLRLQSRLGD